MIYPTLANAYREYLEHLAHGGARVHLPDKPHDPALSINSIFASSLKRCPLLNAFRREKLPEPNPETDARHMSGLHLMQQGVRDAEPFQEALAWKFGLLDSLDDFQPGVDGVLIEYSLQDDELGIRGRADAILCLDEVGHVIEFKRRDARRGEDHPRLKLSDCYQTMTYTKITGFYGHIITLNRYFFNVWSLEALAADTFAARNEAGEPWDGDGHDFPDLSYPALAAEARQQFTYWAAVKDGWPMPPPVEDPLNSPEGWQCGKWENGDKPKKYVKEYRGKLERPERFMGYCTYWCHGGLDGMMAVETAAGSGVYRPLEEIPA